MNLIQKKLGNLIIFSIIFINIILWLIFSINNNLYPTKDIIAHSVGTSSLLFIACSIIINMNKKLFIGFFRNNQHLISSCNKSAIAGFLVMFLHVLNVVKFNPIISTLALSLIFILYLYLGKLKLFEKFISCYFYPNYIILFFLLLSCIASNINFL